MGWTRVMLCGGEADRVIWPMVRTSGNMQFLLNRHRLNVALSRARDSVIIFGHSDCLAVEGKDLVAARHDRQQMADSVEKVGSPKQPGH
nr:AAA domain-containing protein [Pseudomonas sp. BIC9C]